MKTQIPIYRAKKIDSDEYVEGHLISETLLYTKGTETTNDKYEVKDEEWFITSRNGYNYDSIDPSTLAIHFPDMIDSEGTKIFASLSEDGKGGDICNYVFFNGENHHRKYSDTAKYIGHYGMQPSHLTEVERKVKVTGIQQ